MASDFTLYFKDDCGVRNAAGLHEALRAATERGQSAEIDCSGVSQADASFVQLLASGQTTFASRGLGFRIVAPADSVREALVRAGFRLDPGAGRIF
jgi:anti-anti-sigma regulatory factor